MTLPPPETPEQESEHKESSKRYDTIHATLGTTVYESFEQMYAHHDMADNAEYLRIIRSGISRPSIVVKYTPDQTKVNYFNPWVASVLDSNMDIQVILDVLPALRMSCNT